MAGGGAHASVIVVGNPLLSAFLTLHTFWHARMSFRMAAVCLVRGFHSLVMSAVPRAGPVKTGWPAGSWFRSCNVGPVVWVCLMLVMGVFNFVVTLVAFMKQNVMYLYFVGNYVGSIKPSDNAKQKHQQTKHQTREVDGPRAAEVIVPDRRPRLSGTRTIWPGNHIPLCFLSCLRV